MTSAEHVASQLDEAHRRAAALIDGAPLPPRTDDASGVVADALAAGADLRLITLARAFGLSPLESEIIVSLLAAETDPFFRILVRTVQRDSGRPCLEIGTVADLLGVTTRNFATLKRAFEPTAPLRRWALIQNDAGNEGVPLVAQRFRLDPRLVSYLLDDDVLPDGMTLHRVADSAPSLLAPALFDRIARAHRAGDPLLIELVGRSTSTSQTYAVQVAQSLGSPLVVLDLVGTDPLSAEHQLGALAREARLASAIPAVANWNGLIAAPTSSPHGDPEAGGMTGKRVMPSWLARWIQQNVGLLFLVGEDHEPLLGRHAEAVVTIDVPFPTPQERAHLLEQALAGRGLAAADDVDFSTAARRFALDAPLIQIAARSIEESVRARDRETRVVMHSEIMQACRRQVSHDLKSVAERVEHSHKWEDLVIPVDVYHSLREMTAFVKHAQRVYDEWGFGAKHSLAQGVSALFAGPPGTGKTMCASVMARELDMELFRVDLSRVVSKWIGETEKNLSKVFDEAQHSNAIILFDEADSLFAKRTEVKSSVDRYANLEVNFLLQRMEAFGGVTILTTNFEDTIDTAFKRRLTFKMRFERPDADARAALWEKVFPASCAVGSDVDFVALGALYEMSGGNIRSAALRAAFLAADAGSPITMAICKQAAEREAREMGVLIKSGDARMAPDASDDEADSEEYRSAESTDKQNQAGTPRLVPITRPRR